MAHLDDLVVTHQLAGPLDQPDADQQQCEAERRTQGDVGGAETEDRLHLVVAGTSADVEGEVGNDEEHRADSRESEEGSDLSLGALLRFRVHVGGPPRVLGQPGVGQRLRRLQGGAVLVVRGMLVARLGGKVALVVAHAAASSFFLVERAVWAAIQAAKATSPPIPTTHANRPSLTGPMPPRSKPAYWGCSRSE